MRSKDKMQKIKEFIEEYAGESGGDLPSYGEIAEKVGIREESVRNYLEEMGLRGMGTFDGGEFNTSFTEKIDKSVMLIPLMGSIPCGEPTEHDPGVIKLLRFPKELIGDEGGKYFILKASGNSMVDAGIKSGDLVLVRQSVAAREGDIVAALVDNHESTLKRLKRDTYGYYLWGENRMWSKKLRMIRGNFSIQGVAVKVIKELAG